ncbi:hypothetical protein BDV96DRAFT_357245 [Lophiotrema nucula]|uniref:Ubiquitin-like protease family profile domain-containing protein n=1 Tax=Lophiotrema nucula TaxID=690887 RepID=A0A6A5YFL2_9PLEO|nr:hypothetical protein BDV96DRAFT_357245 [Lophiotrema nucula]
MASLSNTNIGDNSTDGGPPRVVSEDVQSTLPGHYFFSEVMCLGIWDAKQLFGASLDVQGILVIDPLVAKAVETYYHDWVAGVPLDPEVLQSLIPALKRARFALIVLHDAAAERPTGHVLNGGRHFSLLLVDTEYRNIIHYDSANNFNSNVAEFWKANMESVNPGAWSLCFQDSAPTWFQFAGPVPQPVHHPQIVSGDCGPAVLWCLRQLLLRIVSCQGGNFYLRSFPYPSNNPNWENSLHSGSIDYSLEDWQDRFHALFERGRMFQCTLSVQRSIENAPKGQILPANVVQNVKASSAVTPEPGSGGLVVEPVIEEDEVATGGGVEIKVEEEEDAVVNTLLVDDGVDSVIGDDPASNVGGDVAADVREHGDTDEPPLISPGRPYDDLELYADPS